MNEAYLSFEWLKTRLDIPQFLLGDAAYAADIPTNGLKAWLGRDPKVIWLGDKDTKSLGRGSARVLTLRRVINIAIVAELVRLNVAPQKAGEIAVLMTEVAGNPDAVKWSKNEAKTTLPDSPFTNLDIWKNLDCIVAVSRTNNSLNVFPNDTPAIEILHHLEEIYSDRNLNSCILLNFRSLLENTFSKLQERGRLD